MLRTITLVVGVLIWSLTACAEDGFTAIFDGKTMEGWEGNTKIFRIENGVIIGGSLKEKIANNEFLCTTKEYGDF